MMSVEHVFTSVAPYGSGGLGRHFRELVESALHRNEKVTCFSTQPPASEGRSVAISNKLPGLVMRYTPVRFSPGWKYCVENEAFDRAVASRLQKPQSPDAVFTGFAGQSLRSLLRARQLGYHRLELVSASSHVRNVQRLHAIALQRWPIESSWLNERHIRRTIREYELADTILVASTYTGETLERYCVPPAKIGRFDLTPDPRFKPATQERAHPRKVFQIVSTGSLTVGKGTPLLIETVDKLRDRSIKLTLIGGSSSRGMRRYLQAALERDPRIEIKPGDPLPYLQEADLFVHASFEDGFAYAPVEAMACGVPVIVTADTGMNERIGTYEQGEIVATGDGTSLEAAIRRRIDSAV
jgi:glycosyltransferase involved in cell wall biosynthesis